MRYCQGVIYNTVYCGCTACVGDGGLVAGSLAAVMVMVKVLSSESLSKSISSTSVTAPVSPSTSNLPMKSQSIQVLHL